MAKKKTLDQPKESVGTPAEDTRSPLELAAPVVATVNLRAIFIDRCFAKRAVKTYERLDEAVLHLGDPSIDFQRVDDSNQFNVLVRHQLAVRPKNSDSNESPLVEMMARFVIIYELPNFKDIDDENLSAFAQTSGVFNTWSYWREFAHSMSFRLGVPQIVLPTFRV